MRLAAAKGGLPVCVVRCLMDRPQARWTWPRLTGFRHLIGSRIWAMHGTRLFNLPAPAPPPCLRLRRHGRSLGARLARHQV